MKMIKFGIVLVAICSMYSMTLGQSGISSSCTNVLVTLSPCLNYITGNSTSPSTSCCTQLGTVVKSSPECLCEVVNSGGGSMAAGLNINQTQALYLPNACNVKTPPLTSCSKASVSSPSQSPVGTSPTTTTPSSVSSGSKTTPTTQGDSSDASMSKLPYFALIMALLFVASHSLTTFTSV
ncbi:non-specific lipid transfer protein GPI-anchored 15-like isoform X2 [Silene latifolia]|uniref:non-specific lipid transfer protein GPI-anchored 15-like isoform X2 n=1 Tax=Silene latifolia TaxID=37657 RepID=UPI003D7861CC